MASGGAGADLSASQLSGASLLRDDIKLHYTQYNPAGQALFNNVALKHFVDLLRETPELKISFDDLVKYFQTDLHKKNFSGSGGGRTYINVVKNYFLEWLRDLTTDEANLLKKALTCELPAKKGAPGSVKKRAPRKRKAEDSDSDDQVEDDGAEEDEDDLPASVTELTKLNAALLTKIKDADQRVAALKSEVKAAQVKVKVAEKARAKLAAQQQKVMVRAFQVMTEHQMAGLPLKTPAASLEADGFDEDDLGSSSVVEGAAKKLRAEGGRAVATRAKKSKDSDQEDEDDEDQDEEDANTGNGGDSEDGGDAEPEPAPVKLKSKVMTLADLPSTGAGAGAHVAPANLVLTGQGGSRVGGAPVPPSPMREVQVAAIERRLGASAGGSASAGAGAPSSEVTDADEAAFVRKSDAAKKAAIAEAKAEKAASQKAEERAAERENLLDSKPTEIHEQLAEIGLLNRDFEYVGPVAATKENLEVLSVFELPARKLRLLGFIA